MAARYVITRSAADKSIVSEQIATNLDMAEAIYTSENGRLEPGEHISLFDARKDVAIKQRRRPTRDDVLADIEKAFSRTINTFLNEQGTLDKFVARLQSDAFNALSWSADAFLAAAKLDVAKRIQALRADNVSWDAIIDEMKSQIVRGARHPGRSSSAQSNLAQQDQLAAIAEMHESLQNIRSWRDDELAKF